MNGAIDLTQKFARRGSRLVLRSSAAFMLCASMVWAQSYPVKPVRIIVPAAVGGGSDLLARFAGNYLDRTLNQRFIVDNRPGAGGNLGAEVTARAAPDGYTLCLITTGNVAINPFVMKDMNFDPLNDLVPVAPVGDSAQTVIAANSLPANSLNELIALARREPGKVLYGSAGVGTTAHLAGELFSQIAGVQMVHVPYKGGGPAVADVVAGRIQIAFLGVSAYRSQFDAGNLKVLAVASPNRMQSIPNVPTARESGTNFLFNTWFGLVTAKGTPPEVVNLLNRQINVMMDDPAFLKVLLNGGLEPMRESPQQFAARIRRDYEVMGNLVKSIGLKPE